MADIFNSESNPVFLNQRERRLAADIAGAFDRNYQASNRARSRYNTGSANDNADLWGIERSRTLVDSINRDRMNQERINAVRDLENQRIAAAQAARPVATNNNAALEELLNQLRNARNPNLNAARTNGLSRGLAGIAQFLPFIMGNDAYSNLMRQGLFGVARNSYNDIFNAPRDYSGGQLAGPAIEPPDNWDLTGNIADNSDYVDFTSGYEPIDWTLLPEYDNWDLMGILG